MDASLKYFARRPCRAVVMVYAMVFAVTAACALYVASSVFQAKQKGVSLAGYATQENTISSQVSNAMIGSSINSLQAGYGIIEPANTWLSYTGSGYLPYTGWPADVQVVQNTVDRVSILQNFASRMATSTLRQHSLWGINSNTITSNSYPFVSNFRPSDLLTTPGFLGYREIDPLGYATPIISDPGFDFKRFIPDLPRDIYRRADLPFSPFDGRGRWTVQELSYELTANSNTYIKTPRPRATQIWYVEEPITNYQLILADPLGTTGWSVGGSGGITLAYPPNTTVFQGPGPRMLMVGGVSTAIASGQDNSNRITGLAVSNVEGVLQRPVVAIVGGTAAPSTATNSLGRQFDVRVASTDTVLSFGRAILPKKSDGSLESPSTPTYRWHSSSLRDFITAPLKANELRGNGATAGGNMRRLQIYNSRGAPMPREGQDGISVVNPGIIASPTESISSYTLPPSTVGAAAANINPIVHMRRDASSGRVFTSWTRQYKTGSGSAAIYSMGAVAVSPQPLTSTSPYPGPIPLTLGPVDLNSPPSLSSYTVNNIALWQQRLSPAAVHNLQGLSAYADTSDNYAVVNLRAINVDDVTASGIISSPGLNVVAQGLAPTPATVNFEYPWYPPNEIHITAMGPPSGTPAVSSSNYTLVVMGSSDTTSSVERPLRIVTDAARIVLQPDSNATTSTAANYRRFILISTNPSSVQITFQATAGAPSPQWYGVIMAPAGAQFAGSGATSASWFGTILLGRSVASDIALTIMPDNGAGLAQSNYNSAATVHNAFVPKYSSSLPSGRPVPLTVPRMLWVFRR